MTITVYFFGSLLEITGKKSVELAVMEDTDALDLFLKKAYPALGSTKYFMAVNQKMVQSNLGLKNNDIVALMPPFSGG